MNAARPFDTALAAVATMVVSWPLMNLLSEPAWVPPAIFLVLTAAVVGALGRAASLRGTAILMLQLAAGVLLAGALFAHSTLFYGLPTLSTVRRANALIFNAEHTVQFFSAPAPATPGLVMLIACILGVVAIAVDYLAVTRGSPAMAGLALLGAFLGCAANSGASMHPIYFLAAAAVWLAMMGGQGTSRLRQWSTTRATPLTPVRNLDGDDGVSAFGVRARNMGVGSLAVALLLPVMLPHLPTRYLLTGLGHSDDGAASGTSFGFSQSADLARDLGDRSTVPVLTYRTSAPTPEPLRVTVTSTYVRGTWIEDGFLDQPPTFTRATALPEPPGVASTIARHDYRLEVRTNSLRAPALAVPSRIRSADLDGADWRVSPLTGTAEVESRPAHYSVVYSQLSPATSQLEDAKASPELQARFNSALDPESRATVVRLGDKLTHGLKTPYDKAMAIQQYFRANGHFEYSLQLAPQTLDSHGRQKHLDPLSNFLETKKGYCVQFATGMVMLARASGIPARLVMGFLPGQLSGKDWTVRASDAHAWPELYFEGIGWTRFEPTPAERSGAPPAYASPSSSGAFTRSGRSPEELAGGARTAPRTSSDNAAEKAYQSRNVGGAPATGVAPVGQGPLSRSWLLVLLGLLVALAGALVVPATSWWTRRSRLRAAGAPADRVEAEWQALTERLGDLGMPPPVSRTPRQLGDYYEQAAYLRGDDAVALHHAVGTLERVRYAAPTEESLSIAGDSRAVVRAVGQGRRRRERLRAALWPSSGLVQLGRLRNRWAFGMRRRSFRSVLGSLRAIGSTRVSAAVRPRDSR